MNSVYLAILVIASSFILFPSEPVITNLRPDPIMIPDSDQTNWEQHAITWLLDAQSPNGGWGAGAHAYQHITDPHAVQTDPATTSFAALALMKAGGPLNENPYQKQIIKALDRLLKDIDQRPDNGRITSLTGTQPQVKLGIHIDASMALQFLTAIRDQINDAAYNEKIDDAAEICIRLIQGSQNADGGWAGGGWAPVLQSAMANNALEAAQDHYVIDKKVIENSRQYQANNIAPEGVRSEDAAGVPLYAAVSAQRATQAEANEVESILDEAVINTLKDKGSEKDIRTALESKGIDRDKADKLARSYSVNQTSNLVLQQDDIWNGFGNNGGEEYLSYMMTSEALARQNHNDWLNWRQTIEPKFKQAQNPNGSWSGQHCITSPVFCTAAILQAWNAGI